MECRILLEGNLDVCAIAKLTKEECTSLGTSKRGAMDAFARGRRVVNVALSKPASRACSHFWPPLMSLKEHG
eukprot:scaffold54920_cov33-Tisochrysis_lutea.AAC.1